MKTGFSFYLKLFWATFTLSAFTVGGGYVIVPLMRKKFVEQYGWIEEDEMLDMIAIAQSAPGPIAVNASMLTGYRLAGIAGSLFALLGTVLPPLITISIITVFYETFRDNPTVSAMLRGMQAGVAAVIVDAVLQMGKSASKGRGWVSLAIMAAVFIAAYFLDVNAALIILLCAAGGVAYAFIKAKRDKGGAA